MYREGGIFALLIGIGLAFLWAFLPFSQEVSYRVSFDEGQPSWTRTEVQCPHPWSVIVEGERPTGGELATTGEECVRPARTLLTGAALALIVGAAVGAYGISRGKRPPPEKIEPISKVIARRSNQD